MRTQAARMHRAKVKRALLTTREKDALVSGASRSGHDQITPNYACYLFELPHKVCIVLVQISPTRMQASWQPSSVSQRLQPSGLCSTYPPNNTRSRLDSCSHRGSFVAPHSKAHSKLQTEKLP